MTKDDVYEKIAESSLFSNLGLFIGSGFSKAVFLTSCFCSPLSWKELLENIARTNGIDWSSIDKEYHSCPEIASIICNHISIDKGIDRKESEKLIKEQICNLTSWYPNQQHRDLCTNQINTLNPKWIITTNYDLIIEGILPNNSNSLGPNDSLVFSNYGIPVYHMHGIRTNPQSLIITNEDYIKLFRPNEYRLHKLSLTINESTTLIMGYGVGDQNVLTALDWSKNVYQNSKAHYPNGVIQLVYTETPNTTPTVSNDGFILLETNNLLDTIKEINEKISEKHSANLLRQEEIKVISGHLINADEAVINAFIDQQDNRRSYLARIAYDYRYIIEPFLGFLTKVFDKCWERARPRGAFSAYAEMTSIVLDVLIEIEYSKMSPALFELIASNFERFSSYIGSAFGESHEALRRWNARKDQIPALTKNELINYANQSSAYRILSILK